MWHVDLAMLYDGLDDWTHTDENIARLVDREDYWLNSEYRQWTTDPNDPEVKAARAERLRKGTKPPPLPVLFPVAARPRDLHDTLVVHAREQAENTGLTSDTAAPGETPKSRKVSIRELQQMRGK